jgi:hypothetical protein
MRKIQTEGFTPLYRDNEQFRILARSLAALTFMKADQVIPAYNIIRNAAEGHNLPNNAISIFDYFGR